MLARFLGLLLPCATLVACSVDASESGSTEDAIQGGAPSALGAVGLLRPPPGGFELCTANLVAPDVVLTAGHCVVADAATANRHVALPRAFYVGRGKATSEDAIDYGSLSKMTAYEVVDVHSFTSDLADVTSPDASTCPRASVDLALVRLKTPVVGVTPLAIGDALPSPGDTCTVTGFGDHTVGEQTTDLQQRTAKVSIVASSESSIASQWKSGIDDRGDSGGALVCNHVIAGTVSCGPDFSGPATSRSYYVPMASHREEIEQIIAAWHDGTR